MLTLDDPQGHPKLNLMVSIESL